MPMQRTPYSRAQPEARTRGSRKPTDPRYGSRRWKATSLRVRRRDGRCLVVPGCPKPAQVADHVYPVYVGMPDREFYDERHLRGACYYHNTLRGQQEKAERELGALRQVHGGVQRNDEHMARSFSRGGPNE